MRLALVPETQPEHPDSVLFRGAGGPEATLATTAQQRPEPAAPRPPHSRPKSWPRETQSSPQRIDAPPPAPLGLWLPLHRRRPRVARVNSNPPAPSPLK